MISRATLQPWLRRPVALVGFAVVALAALLSGGLVVAHAVDGTPVASTTATASPTAAADGTTPANVAGAVNTTDGKTVYAFRLKIVQVSADTVAPTNAAVAVNSGCIGCSTVAVAFEGVVIVGPASTIAPTNLALAANIDCSGCTAFADAYQQVVQSSTRVRITKQGRREIARIRKDLNDLKHSDLTLDQIHARVAADEQAFAAVLRDDLVPVGHVTDPAPADAPDVSDNPDAADAAASPGVSTSSSPDSTPAATDSPAADASPSAVASPSESPSPTASP